MNSALEDSVSDASIRLRHWQFEAMLAEPERVLAEICAFTKVSWRSEILPFAKDRIPWGSRYDALDKAKWYSLRADVNDRYLSDIPDWAADTVTRICGPLTAQFGYTLFDGKES